MSDFLSHCSSIELISALRWNGKSCTCDCTVYQPGGKITRTFELSDLDQLWPYATQVLRLTYDQWNTERDAARLLNERYSVTPDDFTGPAWFLSKRRPISWSDWLETTIENRLGEDPTLRVCPREIGAATSINILELNCPGFADAWDFCSPLDLGPVGTTAMLKILLTKPFLSHPRHTENGQGVYDQILRFHGIGMPAQEIVNALMGRHNESFAVALPTIGL